MSETPTERAMLAAIREHVSTTGGDAGGAIVILADTTPLVDEANSEPDTIWTYLHGGHFAALGLLHTALEPSDPSDEREYQ